MSNLAKILYIQCRFRLKYLMSKKSFNKYEGLRGKKKCLVMLAADYGNLGDVAITYAQELWLAEYYPDYEIVDVPISNTLSRLKALKNICSSDDIITIVGGGNMSDLYFDIELLRQMVVKAFPKNRIISFPQTMFFSNSLGGKYLYQKAKRTYSNHQNLTITARERWSYDFMNGKFLNCKLCPDIVMTLDKREPIAERKGVTICLRNDAESGLTQNFKDKLRADVSSNYIVADYDTHIGRGGLSLEERKNELNKIWTRFRSSEWVITDRLHGMIFAFITGTPCIVFPNNNYKIEGCYNWIKGCGYIYFCTQDNYKSFLNRSNKNFFQDYHSKIRGNINKILV